VGLLPFGSLVAPSAEIEDEWVPSLPFAFPDAALAILLAPSAAIEAWYVW
jgi:hypothetical protein